MKLLFNTCTLILLTGAFFITIPAGAQEDVESHVEIIRLSDRPWLGVQLSDLTEDLIERENLSRTEGAYINEVMNNSPADSAGLHSGDIIIRFGDRAIYDADGLVQAVRRSEKNTPIGVVVIRDGQQRTVTVTLRDQPRRHAIRIPRPPDTPRIRIDHRHGRLGVNVMNLNPQLAEYFKVPEGKGVLVESVRKDSPAGKAGIKAGDVILKIEDREIDNTRRLRRVLATYDAGEEIRLEFMREGARRTVTVELEEREISEFYLPDFDKEEMEFRIFGPGGAEAFRRNLEESLRPGLENFQIEMEKFRDHMKDFRLELPERIHESTRRISL